MPQTLIDVDFMLTNGLLHPRNVGQMSSAASLSDPDHNGSCPPHTVPMYDSAATTAMLERNEAPKGPSACVHLPKGKGAPLIDRPVRSVRNLTAEHGAFLTCPIAASMKMSHDREILVPLTRIDTTMCNDLTIDQRDPIFDRQPTATGATDRLLVSGHRLEKRMRCTSDELQSFTSMALMPSASDPPDGTFCYLKF